MHVKSRDMHSPEALRTESAPAKVNLFLHLRGQRADGYHLLESLVVFPAIGDVLEAERAQGLSLTVDGPFGWELPADGDNLVLRASADFAAMARVRSGAALRLTKNLPIASGIGGGSADAAAALRLLARLWGAQVPEGLALRLGADVPVCCSAPAPRMMRGIGETLSPAPQLPAFWMVLVNALEPVETRAVFRETRDKDRPAADPAPALAHFDALVDWLGAQRNDLEPAARRVCPSIGRVLEALSDAPLARMSGSGGTCFALHATETAALSQAEALRAAQPAWWVAAAPVAVTMRGLGRASPPPHAGEG